MRLTQKETSSNVVDLASSSSSPKNKNKNFHIHHEDDQHRNPKPVGSQNRNTSVKLRIREKGPICKSRKKSAAVFPVSKEEEEDEEDDDGDFVKQFGKEGWPDDDKCMWLSSGSASPSSCFDSYKFSFFLDLSFDEWLVSFLSDLFLGKTISLFDGSRINPIDEATLVLEKTSVDEERFLEEVLKEKEAVTWLVSSIGNELKGSSAVSSFGLSREDSSSSDNSSSMYPADIDSPRILNINRTDFWVSLENFDAEDTQSDLECQSNRGSEVQSCFSCSVFSSLNQIKQEESQLVSCPGPDYISQTVDLDSFSTDEPLFWPSDKKYDSGSEATGEFFTMSPRKNKVGSPENTFINSIGLALQNRKLDLNEWKRRLGFNSGTKSSKNRDKQSESVNKDVGRMNKTPSRLKNSSKLGMKIVPLNIKDDTTEQTYEKLVEYGNFLEEDFAANEELPIETLLGLDEFDGHEGIETEFNQDNFSLEDSF